MEVFMPHDCFQSWIVCGEQDGNGQHMDCRERTWLQGSRHKRERAAQVLVKGFDGIKVTQDCGDRWEDQTCEACVDLGVE
jgi:hypothetical protein